MKKIIRNKIFVGMNTSKGIYVLLFLFFFCASNAQTRFYAGDDSRILYVGRIDYSQPHQPRLWLPGSYFYFHTHDHQIQLIVEDEQLYGQHQNYIEIVIDDTCLQRIHLTRKIDTILIQMPASHDASVHRILVCKDTESGNGYIACRGIICQTLLPPDPLPTRKIECFGNSITCGFGADTSQIPCGKGAWYDQHNAYMSYGAVAARLLHAQWHLSAVSGIGLIHSCCQMRITMPQVYDKINMREDGLLWNFTDYQPDVVTICLGQNDGIQDSAAFCNAYVQFIHTLRRVYPKAYFICLNSPMADEKLNAVLKKYIQSVCDAIKKEGDPQISYFFFTQRYHQGCGEHPDVQEQQEMGRLLAAYIRTRMHW
ncbi:SGNH/GDSL hydrolase family protein [Thermoflavifilum thermophilum]|uniref:GDSL-like Lipase/Acylhydrolase family protein n=1 Tax=Thermoflavifilum thermophilum TaxID=1393122 RepID=A0A1I7MZJ6_9BACT|nr:SGNH/GDSL hydrolase family protein [Thermoflavifilum thermophilum]SFV27831.1 GDSL-like Lipase/Acylhydrolase family protein [Thermoflavifilum thermophilum]